VPIHHSSNQAQFLWRQSCRIQPLGWHRDEFCECAVSLDTQGLVELAGIRTSPPTRCAPAAACIWRKSYIYSSRQRAVPSMTVAETSCPGIRGKETSGFRPRKEFKSLPQNPTILTFSRSSPVAATGSGAVWREAWPGPWSISAFTRKAAFGRTYDSTHTRVERPIAAHSRPS
jgi:hypothetical protein